MKRWTFRIEPADGHKSNAANRWGTSDLYLVNADQHGYALGSITVVGKAEVRVSEVPMTLKRLGEINVEYAYGEGKVAGRDALLVVTEDEAGEGKLTIRVRPEGAETAETH